MTTTIPRLCAWCGKTMGYTTVPGDDPSPTHGICGSCDRKLEQQADTYPGRYEQHEEESMHFYGTDPEMWKP